MQLLSANRFTCTDSSTPAVVYTPNTFSLLSLSLPFDSSPTPLYPTTFLPPTSVFSLFLFLSLSLSLSLALSATHVTEHIFMEMTATRRPCFIEEDDGLASLADMEAGFSGNHHHSHFFFSRPLCHTPPQRKTSLRCLSSSSSFSASSPRSGRFYNGRFEEHQPHFLEACFLCKKPLGGNRDIFMYRGDTPFCSEDCRQEQIEKDEAEEKNRSLSSSMKRKDQKKTTSSNKAQDYPFRTTSTVAAA